MTVRELQAHLRTRRPGQSAALEVSAAGGAARTVNVPVLFAGAEYPWSVPDSFPNAVMAMLEHMAERDPQSGDARYARLGLALGLMNLKEWKRALEVLNGIDLEAVQNGVNSGTLLYHQGRCYEELGDRANAERCYGRAKDFAAATLSTHDGLRIPVLAERRLRTLKN
jgi:tetratricopeptide (TPR) repeat protein